MPPDRAAAIDAMRNAIADPRCPYFDHPEHVPAMCLHCGSDEQLEDAGRNPDAT
jgi:hypothetical protein